MNDKNKQMLKGALIAGGLLLGFNYSKQIFINPNADSIQQVSQTTSSSNDSNTNVSAQNGLIHSINAKTVKANGDKLTFVANINGKSQVIELDMNAVNFTQSNSSQASYQTSQDSNGNSIQTVSLPISVLNKIQPAK